MGGIQSIEASNNDFNWKLNMQDTKCSLQIHISET